MPRRIVGTVAAILLSLFAVVHAPLATPGDRHHAPGVAVMLAGGAVLPPAAPHQTDHFSAAPEAGRITGPGQGTRLPIRPSRVRLAVPAVRDLPGPRAPPPGDL
ncbi:hypothetical protein AB0D67_34360 [Streptosporangium sp. NPDC048047]|uniref:hypothetical protein n=1 Tax=Streptosporangium sp. NPDC048047 TaxID=3155748 RepID=UPI0034157F01